MFWKKKKEEILYFAIGINYLQENEINGINIIDRKENLFKEIEKIGKFFPKESIDIISKNEGYDVFNALVWVDKNIYLYPKKEHRYRNCYEFKGFNPELVPIELQQPFINRIKNQLFFKRTEIEKLSCEFGFSVFDRCFWDSVFIVTLLVKDLNFEVTYYQKENNPI